MFSQQISQEERKITRVFAILCGIYRDHRKWIKSVSSPPLLYHQEWLRKPHSLPLETKIQKIPVDIEVKKYTDSLNTNIRSSKNNASELFSHIPRAIGEATE